MALPVLTYTQDLVSRGPVDVRYLDIGAFANVGEILNALKGAERVMINSFGFFWRHWLGNRVVRALLDSGTEVSVYVHVTQYIFEKEAVEHAERHQGLLELLPRLRLLCVSRAQADYYRKQGAVDPVVVYNTVPRDPGVRRARPEVSAEPRIVMVGTVQDRKGADLFSRVAERAALLGLPWRFSWLGHRMGAMSDRTLLSSHVDWRGALPRRRIREELAESDVLFLSSEDDPMPLAAVEAVQQRLRVVSHHGIGTHEILSGVRGYRGFPEYTPESALAAIADVLGDEVEETGYTEVQELFDITRFGERMDLALGLTGTDGPAAPPGDPLPTVPAMTDRTPPPTSRTSGNWPARAGPRTPSPTVPVYSATIRSWSSTGPWPSSASAPGSDRRSPPRRPPPPPPSPPVTRPGRARRPPRPPPGRVSTDTTSTCCASCAPSVSSSATPPASSSTPWAASPPAAGPSTGPGSSRTG